MCRAERPGLARFLDVLRAGGLALAGALTCMALTSAPAVAQTPGVATGHAGAFDCSRVPPQDTTIPGAISFIYKAAPNRALLLHAFAPTSDHGPHPAIIIFFGGGWRAGMVTAFADRARAYAARGYVAILPDYRVRCRDGTTPFDAIDDAMAAYRWVRAHHRKLDIDLTRIVLSGGSAGGHVALMTTLRQPADKRPAALVLYNPAIDLTAMPDYITLPKARAAQISPSLMSVKGLPPTIIFHGAADRTVPIATVRSYCQSISDQGGVCQLVVYAGQDHGFFHSHTNDPLIPGPHPTSPYEDTLAKSLTFLGQLGVTDGPLQPVAAEPDIYLLAGQSNMSGRGLVSDLTADERTPDPMISLYGNDAHYRLATAPLDSPDGQVDTVSFDANPGVGPGLMFARALRKLRDRPILLVPCAKGETTIVDWAPAEGRNTLYGSCLARAKETGGRIAGLLWYQGEADSKTQAAAKAWGGNFKRMVTRLRADLSEPHLPVVFVQIADAPNLAQKAKAHPAWTTVQAIQAKLFLSCGAMVSAEGLPLKEDSMHLTTASQRVLGGRMASAMADLLTRPACR